jgi:hypothetical protein
MLYVVTPFYVTYILFTFIFTIVFSESGLPNTSSQTTWEDATLANNLLLLSSYFAVCFTLVLMSANRANWNIQGGTVQPGMPHVVDNCNFRSLTIDAPQEPTCQHSSTGRNLPNRIMGRSNTCNPTPDSWSVSLRIIIMGRNRRLCPNTRCTYQRYTMPQAQMHQPQIYTPHPQQVHTPGPHPSMIHFNTLLPSHCRNKSAPYNSTKCIASVCLAES